METTDVPNQNEAGNKVTELLNIRSSLKEFHQIYKDEKLIFKRIFDVMRLKAGDVCVCRSPISRYWEQKGRFKFRCKVCRRTISPLSQTPLKGLKIPLTTVMDICYLTFTSKHGLTASEIARVHGISYNSALLLKHRLQIWMGLTVQAFRFVNCTVQIDEAFVKSGDGTGEIRHNIGYSGERLTPVVTMVEHGGNERAKAFVVPKVNKPTLKNLIEKNIDDNCTIYTDGNPVYHFLSSRGYLHFECNHSAGEYSRAGVHVNGCESLHGLLQSKLYHVHRGVTAEHLQKYADEITWTFMNRSKNVYDAINSLFDALPPLNSKVIIKPNTDYKK